MDVVTLELAKKYVSQTVSGMGAVKGAPVQIESIERDQSGKGSNITFAWEDNGGESHTSVLFIPDGEEGPAGPQGPQGPPGDSAAELIDRGEITLSVNDSGHLILEYTV